MDLEELRAKYKKEIFPTIPVLERLQTGVLALDLVSCGGLPKGRIVEIIGKASSGKTTLALHGVKGVLDQGLSALIVDYERTIENDDLLRVGIQPNHEGLVYARPATGEKGIDLICDACAADIAMVVVDSVPTMTLSYMDKVDTEDQRKYQSPIAGLFGRNNGRLVQAVSTANTVCVLLNQPRMRQAGAHAMEVSYGGEFFNFTPSLKLKTRRLEDTKDGKGILSCITSTKNKTGPKGILTELFIRYEDGIYAPHTTLLEGQHYGVIVRGAAIYRIHPDYAAAFPEFEGGLLARGKEQAIQILLGAPKLRQRLDQLILGCFLNQLKTAVPPQEGSPDQEEED